MLHVGKRSYSQPAEHVAVSLYKTLYSVDLAVIGFVLLH